jgi:hypothetical protein
MLMLPKAKKNNPTFHNLDILEHSSSSAPNLPKMSKSTVPKPGPARLTKSAGLEEWLEEAKQCHYLPESVMKQLCEIVKECLMEGRFWQNL